MKLDGLLMTNYVFQNNLGPGQAAQWLAHHPIQQKVVGSIPHWGMYGRQLIDVSLPHRCFSPSLFSPFLSF